MAVGVGRVEGLVGWVGKIGCGGGWGKGLYRSVGQCDCVVGGIRW